MDKKKKMLIGEIILLAMSIIFIIGCAIANQEKQEINFEKEELADEVIEETDLLEENEKVIDDEVETVVVEQQETPKPVETQSSTPQDLSYWCVEGGAHHVLGDGANEHGYYGSWDEANQAFQSYTAGWNAVQYKFGQCACGLYYFWAIPQ